MIRFNGDDLAKALSNIENKIIENGGNPKDGSGQIRFLSNNHLELMMIKDFFVTKKGYGARTAYGVAVGFMLATELIKVTRGE